MRRRGHPAPGTGAEAAKYPAPGRRYYGLSYVLAVADAERVVVTARRRQRPVFAPRRRLSPSAVLGAALLVAVVAAALLGGGGGSDEGEDLGVVHVHGLGVNPADGDLYVATHHGLYRLPAEGEAVRVGDAYQDTMAFTVAGPDRFLASGHPDLEDEALRVPGKPPLLGLVESVDGGHTWKPWSLLGEADFHLLASGARVVYGWNATAGELLASADMVEWERRAALDLVALAVDPRSDDRLVAGDGTTVLTSADGGRTWEPSGVAPAAVALAWGEDGLWGVDGEGGVHRRDGDGGWGRVGRLPGPPEALTVDGETMYASVQEDERSAVYESGDGGETWRLRYRGAPRSQTITE